MSTAEKVFAVILKAYPREFRAAYGGEMMVVFRDHYRDNGHNTIRFWSELAWDVLKSAPSLRFQVWRARTLASAMAVQAILIGGVEVVNASMEGWAGGVVDGAPESLLVGTLGIVAGGLLLSSGVALLRGSPHARGLAKKAALTCLGVFVFTGFVIARMSIFATLLGTAFPIAMLLFVRNRSTPTVR